MSEPIRAKMHIWGPNRVQKVIFVDELEAYEEKGWRDHPDKVGKPVERMSRSMEKRIAVQKGEALPTFESETPEAPKKRGRKPKI